MSFSKKDYEKIAKVIQELPSQAVEVSWGEGLFITRVVSKARLCQDMISMLAEDNETFDPDKFRTACYQEMLDVSR